MKAYRLVEVENLVKEYIVTADSEQDAREQWEAGMLGKPDSVDCVLCNLEQVEEYDGVLRV